MCHGMNLWGHLKYTGKNNVIVPVCLEYSFQYFYDLFDAVGKRKWKWLLVIGNISGIYTIINYLNSLYLYFWKKGKNMILCM